MRKKKIFYSSLLISSIFLVNFGLLSENIDAAEPKNQNISTSFALPVSAKKELTFGYTSKTPDYSFGNLVSKGNTLESKEINSPEIFVNDERYTQEGYQMSINFKPFKNTKTGKVLNEANVYMNSTVDKVKETEFNDMTIDLLLKDKKDVFNKDVVILKSLKGQGTGNYKFGGTITPIKTKVVVNKSEIEYNSTYKGDVVITLSPLIQ